MQTLKKQRWIYKHWKKNEIGVNIKKHVLMQNIEKSRGRYNIEKTEKGVNIKKKMMMQTSNM